MNRLSPRPLAFLYLTLTTSIWGSLYVVTRVALQTMGPLTLLCLRYLLASVTLMLLARVTGRSLKVAAEDRGRLVFIGVVGYFVSVGAQVVGIRYAGASAASLINAMNPVFITLFAALLLQERLTWPKAAATAATLAGAWIILGGSQAVGEAWGIGFSLLSVVLWSWTSTVVRRVTAVYDPLVVTAWAITIALVCSAPAAGVELVLSPPGALWSVTNLLCVLYLGILATALPNFLWNKSLSMVEASTCGLFYPLQPLVAVTLGVTLLGERLDWRLGVGAVLIVGGILVALRAEGRRR